MVSESELQNAPFSTYMTVLTDFNAAQFLIIKLKIDFLTATPTWENNLSTVSEINTLFFLQVYLQWTFIGCECPGYSIDLSLNFNLWLLSNFLKYALN